MLLRIKINRRPFGQPIGGGWPSFSSLALSAFLHGLAVAALGMISSATRLEKPKSHPPSTSQATTIRIGDRIYFVSRFSPLPRPVTQQQEAARRTNSAKPAGRHLEAPQAPAAERPEPARAFIPPNTPRNLVSDATLIQPAFPPDLPAVVPQLPSFRIWTAPLQAPRIPKPFVAPGRRTPLPEQAQAPAPPPPNLELVHADPVVSNLKSLLVLPPTPAPQMDPPPRIAPDAPPPAPAGDAVNILSLNDRPAPPSDRLVVPPGNVAGRVGDETGTGAGGTARTSTAATNARGGSENSRGASDQGEKAADSGGADRLAANRAPGASGAVSSSGVSSSGVSSSGASAPGPSGPPGGVTISGGGAARSSPAAASASKVIVRPPNGSFDAVVIQSSSLDQFPESKGLLSGRPIYTVFISVGTSKDWALYFCVPGEKAGAAKTNVIELGPVPPVQAPYPTRLVRPEVGVPAYYKYVLVHGYVNATGRFENLRVVRSIRSETDEAILASLSGWEFRAATRDGIKVAVEFLLSIPVTGL